MQFSFLIAIMQGCTTYTQPSQGCVNIAKIIVYIVLFSQEKFVPTIHNTLLSVPIKMQVYKKLVTTMHTMLWEPCCNLELSIWQCKGERERTLLLLPPCI